MALENTLEELAERRLAFKSYREGVEEELRKLRIEKLAAEQASIEHIIVKAMAEGATLGQIKRAYGTKDHRTIANIVTARAAEIEALQNAKREEKAATDWFQIGSLTGLILVKSGKHQAYYSWAEVDGKIMFTTEEPLWNEDFTVRNEAVGLLDGKTEDDNEEAGVLAKAIRQRG